MVMNDYSDQKVGKELFAYIKQRTKKTNLFKFSWLKNQVLKISIQNKKLQTQLFRFVDVLPSLKTKEKRLDIFLQYLQEGRSILYAPSLFAAQTPIIKEFLDWVIKFSVRELAKTFICASNIKEAKKSIKNLAIKKQYYTLDLLGESTLNKEEANKYFFDYQKLLEEIPNTHLSIKLSALEPHINILDFNIKKNNLLEKLRELFRLAIARQASINIDTEQFFWKDFYFDLLKEILMEEEFKSWTGAGIVVQAYLKDSSKDLNDWILWAKKRKAPITIRLVKGAYWDYEYAKALQQNWDCPVYTQKYQSDLNYENLTEILLDSYNFVRPALASHNIRSLAHAINYANKKSIPKDRFEFQMLYGMLDEIKDYFSENSYTLRVYLPYGDLVQGMSYLVRRLLENTANDSFLRQGFLDGASEDELLEDPRKKSNQANVIQSKSSFENVANLDFSKISNHHQIQKAISELRVEFKAEKKYSCLIGAEKVMAKDFFESINPAKPSEILGLVSYGSKHDCDRAVSLAKDIQKKWFQIGCEKRARILKQVADEVNHERFRLIALLCLEAGKPWIEADAEVSEAVDFLNYYTDESLKLFNDDRLRVLPGENNYNIYQAYGVSAIIPPWNFPLAILVGLASAALAAGNSVVVKPSQQTSLIAYEFVRIFNKVLSKSDYRQYLGLVNLITGEGKSIGNYLVEHPDINLIAFTGSNEVGMNIYQKSALNKPPKRVVAEMGGKNAVIIDESADLDEAIPGLIYSAFGFSGQKCSAASRLIIHQSIYSEFIDRLKRSLQEVLITDPSLAECYMGPVIDANAQIKINNYISLGKKTASAIVSDLNLPEQGYFVSPTVFCDVSENSVLATDEIFGPVLIVFKANNINHAISLANNSSFGLTGAIYSRSPNNIKKAIDEMVVGNLYINRPCTGAVVSRQAFGGLKNSSIGFKAGGPNYLLQFVQEKTITENTMRRGFADE
jgi:RHH-type proline utilization regulon transcriptional repressor/proline dehydrogenase/delta 1-pyrroline-5-carboxylate dehydrogenase